MTIYQRMASICEATGIPGFLNEWMATDEYPVIPDTYLTYLVDMESEAMAADDDELVREQVVWIDLYGCTDASAPLDALRQALRAGGFLVPWTRDMDNQRLSRHQYHRRLKATYYDYL